MTKSTTSAKKESKTESTKPVFKSLTKSKSPTLSGAGTIGYEISDSKSTGLQVRLTSNSGNGNFGREWLNVNGVVDSLLVHAEKHPITALALQKSYPPNSSINSCGFMAAVLLSLGLLERADNKRQLKLCDNPAELIASLKEAKPKHKPPRKRKPKAEV